jgi:hypothetical protein
LTPPKDFTVPPMVLVAIGVAAVICHCLAIVCYLLLGNVHLVHLAQCASVALCEIFAPFSLNIKITVKT